MERGTDVFLSYARVDRPRVKKLVDLLQSSGFKVWWDLDIPPGKRFDDFIREKLRINKAVLVIWSKTSAASDYVRGEAREAAATNKLVSVTIDPWKDVKESLPLDFHGIEHADLSGWSGDTSDHEFRLVLESLEKLTKTKAIPPKPPTFSFKLFYVAAGSAVILILSITYILWARVGADCELVVEVRPLQSLPEMVIIDYLEIAGKETHRFPISDNKAIIRIDSSSVSNWVLVIAWSDRHQTKIGPFGGCPRDTFMESTDVRAKVSFVAP